LAEEARIDSRKIQRALELRATGYREATRQRWKLDDYFWSVPSAPYKNEFLLPLLSRRLEEHEEIQNDLRDFVSS
jgi:hypothetical protein